VIGSSLVQGVFICYRRADSADVTGRLYDRLTERYGRARVFKDVFDIPYGDDFRDTIAKALRRCDVLLVVVGNAWNPALLARPADPVRAEIELAMELGLRIIPVFVRGATMPVATAVPEELAWFVNRNGARLRDDPDFDPDVKSLLDQIGSARRRVLSIAAVIVLVVLGGVAYAIATSGSDVTGSIDSGSISAPAEAGVDSPPDSSRIEREPLDGSVTSGSNKPPPPPPPPTIETIFESLRLPTACARVIRKSLSPDKRWFTIVCTCRTTGKESAAFNVRVDPDDLATSRTTLHRRITEEACRER
jgi:hypothetical protein